jgi:hypothetical protein
MKDAETFLLVPHSMIPQLELESGSLRGDLQPGCPKLGREVAEAGGYEVHG